MGHIIRLSILHHSSFKESMGLPTMSELRRQTGEEERAFIKAHQYLNKKVRLSPPLSL